MKSGKNSSKIKKQRLRYSNTTANIILSSYGLRYDVRYDVRYDGQTITLLR